MMNNSQTSSNVRKSSYNVKGIENIYSERRKALKEFDSYFDKRVFTSYKEWAKEEIHYNECEDAEIMEKLQSINNGYTTAMGAQVVSSYCNGGIDLDNLFDVYVSYTVMRMYNKDIDSDIAKSMEQFSKNISESCGSLPLGIKMFIKPAATAMSWGFNTSQTAHQKKMIDTHVKDHDIDSMIMSARQIAAIKVNFMEQCYVDMRRKGSTIEDVMQCESNYNKAVTHLEQIAKNSGLDMAAVAAEERFIVGLKMKDNPDYKVLFNETIGPYSAQPVFDDAKTWSGEFKTGDGHAYTVGNHVHTGAFTVRRPCGFDVNMQSTKETVNRYAMQFAAINTVLENDEYPYKKYMTAVASKDIQKRMDAYKESMITMLYDDGVVTNKAQAHEWWRQNFEKPRSKAIDEFRRNSFAKMSSHYDNDGNYHVDELNAYGGLINETDRLLNKEIFIKTGQPYDKATESELMKIMKNEYENEKRAIDRQSLNTANIKEMESNCPQLRAFKETADAQSIAYSNSPDSRTSTEILKAARENYVRNMDGHELADMYMHAATNIEQGWENRGSYDRLYGIENPVSQKTNTDRAKSQSHHNEVSQDASDGFEQRFVDMDEFEI